MEYLKTTYDYLMMFFYLVVLEDSFGPPQARGQNLFKDPGAWRQLQSDGSGALHYGMSLGELTIYIYTLI